MRPTDDSPWCLTKKTQRNLIVSRDTKGHFPDACCSDCSVSGPLAGGGEGEGVGEVQKKYSRKGKLPEKKFIHAN